VLWNEALGERRRFFCADPWGNRLEFIASAYARSNAPANNETFETRGLTGAEAAYRTVRVTDSKSLPPCPPGTTLGQFGPPMCNGDPPWESVTLVAYGALKPNGPKAQVAVTVAGEPSVFLHGPAAVAEEILSGRIR
jgi:hypothetical protein